MSDKREPADYSAKRLRIIAAWFIEQNLAEPAAHLMVTADALESQAREIAELSKARDGYYHTAADALAKRDATQRKLAEAWELLREARDYSTRPPASLTCDCDTCKAKRSFPRRVAAALVEKP